MSAQKASPPPRSPERNQRRAEPAAKVDLDARLGQAATLPADPPLSPAALQLYQRIVSIREKLASSALQYHPPAAGEQPAAVASGP
jgi:hypothetical protein